jgi:DNA-binding MarR family transcriptional regulator
MENSPFNLTHQNNSIESKIIAALERISQAFRVLLWEESKEHALSPIQVQVLIFVLFQSLEKCRVSYLADEFNMTRATMSDTIKALANKDLITKINDPNDHRSYTIHLTESGRTLAEKTSVFTREIIAPVEKLNAGDKENLLLSLFSIIHNLNKSGVITIQRMCFTCIHYLNKDAGKTHFCKLLNIKLEPIELRVDCPEHELKE